MAALRQLPAIQAADAAQAAPVAVAPAVRGDDRPGWGATRCLIAATATAGLAGIPLGLTLAYWTLAGSIGDVPWIAWVQAHGQLQLFGWLGLAILGVTFHALPHLFGTARASERLIWSVLTLQLVGVGLRFLSPLFARADTALRPWSAGSWTLLASAVALLAAFAVTLVSHARALPGRDPTRRTPAVLPRYLLAGLLLWLTSLLVNLDGAFDALRFGPPVAGAISVARDAFVVTAAGYGIALFALGMSLRVVVGWLDLPPPGLSRARLAWFPLALGALLRTAGAATGDLGALQTLAALAWTAGIILYISALPALWFPAAVTHGGGRSGESDPPLAWFVRAAFVGLATSGILAAVEVWVTITGTVDYLTPHSLTDAGRHALLFGFLGVLTAGLTGRLPTAFLDLGDRGITTTRAAFQWTWRLIVPAAALRIAGPLAGDARSAMIALSGLLGTLALWCLLCALLQMVALRRRRPRTPHA